MDSSVPAA
jgi:hypothetical protein